MYIFIYVFIYIYFFYSLLFRIASKINHCLIIRCLVKRRPILGIAAGFFSGWLRFRLRYTSERSRWQSASGTGSKRALRLEIMEISYIVRCRHRSPSLGTGLQCSRTYQIRGKTCSFWLYDKIFLVANNCLCATLI